MERRHGTWTLVGWSLADGTPPRAETVRVPGDATLGDLVGRLEGARTLLAVVLPPAGDPFSATIDRPRGMRPLAVVTFHGRACGRPAGCRRLLDDPAEPLRDAMVPCAS